MLIKLVTRSLELGQDYMFCHKHVKLIQTSPRGCNLLHLRTSKCVLEHAMHIKYGDGAVRDFVLPEKLSRAIRIYQPKKGKTKCEN